MAPENNKQGESDEEKGRNDLSGDAEETDSGSCGRERSLNVPHPTVGNASAQDLSGPAQSSAVRSSGHGSSSFSLSQFLINGKGASRSRLQVIPDLYPHSETPHFPDNSPDRPPQSPVIADRTILPDFVQDHLDGERRKNRPRLPDFAGSNEASPGDVDVGRSEEQENAPPELPTTLQGPAVVANHTRRSRNVPPLDLPINRCAEKRSRSSVLSFDLNQYAQSSFLPSLEPSVPTPSSELPDFLSDSHVLSRTTPRTRQSRSRSIMQDSPVAESSSASRLEMLQIENEALRREIESLNDLVYRQTSRAEQAENAVVMLKAMKNQEPCCSRHSASSVKEDDRSKDEEIKALKKELQQTKEMLKNYEQNGSSNNTMQEVKDLCSCYSVQLRTETDSIAQLLNNVLTHLSQLENISDDLRTVPESSSKSKKDSENGTEPAQ